MPPKKTIKRNASPTNHPVSFHIYIRRCFHVIAKNTNYVTRIAKDAVDHLNVFLNDFISHVTRSACKIARDDDRKTLLERDIDAVFYTLFSTDEYLGSKVDFKDAMRDHKEFMEDPYHKKPASLGDKYDILLFSPTRILKAMRQAEPKMRISELSVIRLSAYIDNMFTLIFGPSMDTNITRRKDGKRYTRTISWEIIRERIVEFEDKKISYCRFNL